MEHLALEIFDRSGTGSKFAFLDPNTRIRIRRSSRIFGKGEVWSHDFSLNTKANAQIFGSAGDLHGSRLHEQIDKRKARLWVEGMPLYLGHLTLDNEADVDEDGNVNVRFEGGQKTFEQLIDGAKANQVPMLGNVQIGMALWRKRFVQQKVKMRAEVAFGDGTSQVVDIRKYGEKEFWINIDGEDDGTPTQEYPRLVYPKGRFYNKQNNEWEDVTDCLNTDSPYIESTDGTPIHPYCNVTLCYQKYGYEKTDDQGNVTTDYSGEPEAQRGYEVMPANRVNSAPCFFVIYWIRALMKHLDIYIEENQMLNVEDLRRLFFVNTRCDYDEPDKMRTTSSHGEYGIYTYTDKENTPDLGEQHDYVAEYLPPEPFADKKESHFDCTFHGELQEWKPGDATMFSDAEKTITKVKVLITSIAKWYSGKYPQEPTPQSIIDYKKDNRLFHKAFATSECFPNIDISEVLQALESGFGIRFLFDDNYQRVRIVLLRNIFRSSDVQELTCNILSESKTENSTRGFRMTYGDSDDTHFYYKGFADKLPHKKEIWVDTSDTHDYSKWELGADYASVINKISAFDKTCYVTPGTGNAYGIKIDKDAKRYKDLHPAAFEFAGFMDAEDGDCTGEDETIETIALNFTPTIMNDINIEEERNGSRKQQFALFVDEQMKPRRPDLADLPSADQPDIASYNDADAEYSVTKLYKDKSFSTAKSGGIIQPGLFSIASDACTNITGLSADTVRKETYRVIEHSTLTYKVFWDLSLDISGYINEGYRLYLQDNYEPNDNGVSPIETHDWGLTLGIMRGSGSDAYVGYSYDEDDGEGNDTWDIVSGSSATAHPDTCDNYGNLWDYNGSNGQTIHCETPTDAINAMLRMWPNSNIDLQNRNANSYIEVTYVKDVVNNTGAKVALLLAMSTPSDVLYTGDYAKKFRGMTTEQMFAFDSGAEGFGILIEVGSSMERKRTLEALQQLAFKPNAAPVVIDGGDNGIGVTEGRFSLKLRAEKPNPNYGKSGEPQYLGITNTNLQGRGLMDQFYKEYSYWIRNARIANFKLDIGIAELMALDDTVKMKVGDVTGLMKDLEFDVDMQSGLQPATLKLMYI